MAAGTSAPWYGYTDGQCTWYVANQAPWVRTYGNLGDAWTWLDRAHAAGADTGSLPLPGAIAVWGQNMGEAHGDGHVAIVTSVNGDGTPNVSEMNWSSGPFNADTRNTAVNNSYKGIIGYIYAPNTALAQSTALGAQASPGAQAAGSHPVTEVTAAGNCLSLTDMLNSALGGQVPIIGGLFKGVQAPILFLKWAAQPCVIARSKWTLFGVVLVGVGTWMLFRKEIDSAAVKVVGAAGKVMAA